MDLLALNVMDAVYFMRNFYEANLVLIGNVLVYWFDVSPTHILVMFSLSYVCW